MSIALDSVLLTQSAPVELFELDVTPLGGAVFRFAAQLNELRAAIVWQGQTFQPLPIRAEGFEQRATGPFARPTLSCSNTLGTLGPLIRDYNNLRGAKLTRRRTMARYLDAANFAAGNAQADPLAEFEPELWLIDQCTGRNRHTVAWELRSPLDFQGVQLPSRVVQGNYCPWRYRSSSCGYTGGAVAKADDTPTAVLGEDKCSKRLSGCKLRFPGQALPFGGFPGVGQLRAL